MATRGARVAIRRAHGATYREIALIEGMDSRAVEDCAPFQGIPGAAALKKKMQEAVLENNPAALIDAADGVGINVAAILQAGNESLVAVRYMEDPVTETIIGVPDYDARLRGAKFLADFLGFSKINQAPTVTPQVIHVLHGVSSDARIEEARRIKRLTGNGDFLEAVEIHEKRSIRYGAVRREGDSGDGPPVLNSGAEDPPGAGGAGEPGLRDHEGGGEKAPGW